MILGPVIAALIIIVHYWIFSLDLTILHGATAQQTSFDLGVRHGRVVSLQTHLTAHCSNATDWGDTWHPSEGLPIHFRNRGRSVAAVEVGVLHWAHGVHARAEFSLRGTLTGRGSAEGTVRLTARFFAGNTPYTVCDSRDVPWAVGPQRATTPATSVVS